MGSTFSLETIMPDAALRSPQSSSRSNMSGDKGVIAAEIVEDLEAALAEFAEIATALDDSEA